MQSSKRNRNNSTKLPTRRNKMASHRLTSLVDVCSEARNRWPHTDSHLWWMYVVKRGNTEGRFAHEHPCVVFHIRTSLVVNDSAYCRVKRGNVEGDSHRNTHAWFFTDSHLWWPMTVRIAESEERKCRGAIHIGTLRGFLTDSHLWWPVWVPRCVLKLVAAQPKR